MPSEKIELHSFSLMLDEQSLFKGPSLASLLPLEPLPYKFQSIHKNLEQASPYLTFMPEVFHQKLNAYSKPEFIVVNQLYRLVEVLRYNFSNGMQISAKEILRHPLHQFVPEEFLPQLKSHSLNYGHQSIAPWPLIQKEGGPIVKPVEEIMQALLSRITTAQRQKRISIYIQTQGNSSKSLSVQNIEFEPGNELDWRVDIIEKKNIKAEFKLISDKRKIFYFFESYAIDPDSGTIVVHPWLTEFSLLQEHLSNLSLDLILETNGGMPFFELTSESRTKKIVKYLRTRVLPVKISGGSASLVKDQSQTEIHLSENGNFIIQHEARVLGQKDIQRRGWSERSVFYLMALSQGLPYAMQTLARDMASVDNFQREWDLALLKHLGIFQYLFLEVLSVRFDGATTDGKVVTPEALFSALDEKIKIILTSNDQEENYSEASLGHLCSRSVLLCFEKFVSTLFDDLSQSEAFYSELGEVVMEGVLEREMRLIYELLKRYAMVTSGNAFKKVRVPFLGRISSGLFESESAFADSEFYFPEGSLSASLEICQSLVPFGFKIFFKTQPIHELAGTDLNFDFELQSRMDQDQINWFELSPKFFLMGQEVDPENILRLGSGGIIEYENKLYLVPQTQMPSLRLLEEFWKRLQKGKAESAKKKNGVNYYQLPRSQTLSLLALRNAGVPIHGDKKWLEICEFYDNLGKTTRSLNLPNSVKEKLKPYQVLGVQWLQDLYRLRLGALLADDMGLGKTFQVLSFLEALRVNKEMGTVLVVVPSSLVFNWQSEIEKFTPEIPVTIFTGEMAAILAQKKDRILIVTYGLLLEHGEEFTKMPWNIVVFDEAQNIKNINAKRTSVARALNAKFKIALSGTPMENHYGELYSLIDMLVPGSLGPLEDFRRAYVNSPAIAYELIQDLKLKIKPLMLRRSKKEILDQLPDKQETTISIAFEELQKEIYFNVALSYNQRVQEAMASQGAAQVQLQMFTALLRLRQVCSDPAALPDVSYEKTPPKLETLVESLKEIIESGESALVFTQFLQTLEHTEELLKMANIPVYVIHGGISSVKRQKVLSEFTNSGGGAVLLMTLKTGGVGLNLVKASYVFHIEPWWNPAVENQATDRAHRMGQTKAVQVFKYIMHESLEEKIELLKDRKDKRFQALFTDSEKSAIAESVTKTLTKEDFDQLLGI
jgi:superfamily II DNA or RNA helicase